MIQLTIICHFITNIICVYLSKTLKFFYSLFGRYIRQISKKKVLKKYRKKEEKKKNLLPTECQQAFRNNKYFLNVYRLLLPLTTKFIKEMTLKLLKRILVLKTHTHKNNHLRLSSLNLCAHII